MSPRPTLILATLALAACQAQTPTQPSTPPSTLQASAATSQAASVQVAFPQYPCISPDGKAIVFSFAGDLWSVPASGGTAARLTAHPSDESRSVFSPDGSSLAFESERDGPANIYIMPVRTAFAGEPGALTSGPPRRITTYDKAQALSGFTPDGSAVLFSASLDPSIYRMTRMYSAPATLPTDGGAPITRLSDAFGGAPRMAADGSILFNRERYDPTRTKYTGPASCDVYRLDPKSNSFTQLTFDPHADGEAFPLPDGSVVFVSSRDGENNLYRLAPGATDKQAPRQLTRFALAGPGRGANQTTIMHGVRDLSVTGWNAVFCVWDTLYTLDLKADNAQPRAVALSAGGDFSQLDFQRVSVGRQMQDAALSPDGKTVAVISRGEIFIRSTDKDRPTRHVTATGKPSPWGRCRDLAWSADGRVLYFSSDASGIPGIYAASVAMSREDLAKEEKPAAPKPEAKPEEAKPDEPKEDLKAEEPKKDDPEAPKAEGDAPKDEPKKDAPRTPAPKKPDWGKRWSEAVTFTFEPVLVSETEYRRPQPSPDGKRLMVTRGLGDLVRFDIVKDEPTKLADTTGTRIIESWNDPEAQWTADSRHIVYAVEDVWFNSDVWILDALTDGAKPVNVTRHPDVDHAPRLSADGKVLYFLSDRDADTNGQDDLYAINLDRTLDGLRPYELAEYYTEAGAAARRRAPLGAPAPAAGARPTGGASAPAAGGSGRPGGRRGGGGPGAGAPAAAPAPAAEEKPAEAADDKKPEEPKPETAKLSPENPIKFDLDDAHTRVRRISGAPRNIGQLEITPAADRILLTASTDGSTQFLSIDYKGADRRTISAGSASNISVSLTGDRVLFVGGGGAPRPEGAPEPGGRFGGGGGELQLGRPTGGEAERLPIEASITVDIAAQQRQKFRDAARLMGQRFYHPTLKGLDWPAMMARYESIITRTRTDTEFNRIFNNLLGELEGSHMGMSGGRNTAGSGESLGYLGIDVKPVAGGYQVTRIVPAGPAARPALRQSVTLAVGDVIRSINSKPLAEAGAVPTIDFMAAMQGTSGQETLLELSPAAGAAPDAKSRFIILTPTSSGADTVLRYRAEVEQRRQEVDRLSGGKLGYLHIRAMDMASVRDYERDLFAAADGKLGLVIDVRDNGGGSTNDILLSSLTAPRHAYTASRGVSLDSVPKDAYPRDRRLIYAYNRAITVLCNQHSYSNAEIFSHAIKTIKRGTLVGQQTFGAVISTGSYSLIDGTTMRTPFRGWYLPDGTDMENNGAMPDIVVMQTPADEAAGRDPQLEAAVKELLTRAKLP